MESNNIIIDSFEEKESKPKTINEKNTISEENFSIEPEKSTIILDNYNSQEVNSLPVNDSSVHEKLKLDVPVSVITSTTTNFQIKAFPILRKQSSQRDRRDLMSIEKSNLISICKLVIKKLIDSSISFGCMVDDQHIPLEQFFIVFENIMCHGLKIKKGLIRDKKDIWGAIELISKYSHELNDVIISIKDMTYIKTGLGKLRAFLRFSIMQKKLPDYFSLLQDYKDVILGEYYESTALILSDEASVVSGLLIGLNFIDCNVVIKDDDLDLPLGIIDYSSYLKEIIGIEETVGKESEQDHMKKLNSIIDQKNYLEELNRNYITTIANLNQKLDIMATDNVLMKEEILAGKTSFVQLQHENSLLRCENLALLEGHHKQMMTAQQDIQTERNTYQISRQGLDVMCQEAKKKMDEEIKMRLDTEKELQLQIYLKQEIELAMRLLEKDVHEKQDLIILLRKQLEDVKKINLEIHEKLKSKESVLEHKTELVSRLETKTNQMAISIRDMEDEIKQCQNDKKTTEETLMKMTGRLIELETDRQNLQTDLKVERDWKATLQTNLEKEKVKLWQLQSELQDLADVKKDHENIQSRYRKLESVCEDQEKALAELGCKLSQSKLQVENLMEEQIIIKEAHWADDKVVNDCRQCCKPFSVSRRKHHCRSCGEIFCNECSNIKMPLPSCPKPVRVCDSCSTKLLQKYSIG